MTKAYFRFICFGTLLIAAVTIYLIIDLGTSFGFEASHIIWIILSAIFGVCPFIISGIVKSHNKNEAEKEKIAKEHKQRKEESFLDKSDRLIDKYNKEYNAYKINYDVKIQNINKKIQQSKSYEKYWIEENNIKTYSDKPPCKHKVNFTDESITPPKQGEVVESVFVQAISSISFWVVEGEKKYLEQVSGGGINVPGAIKGALLAGGIGAFIGSQIGTETKRTYTENDQRQVIVSYTDRPHMVFPISTLSVFENLLYDKEYKAVNSSAPATKSAIPSNELRELKALLDEGIITQEEFDTKKKQILG